MFNNFCNTVSLTVYSKYIHGCINNYMNTGAYLNYLSLRKLQLNVYNDQKHTKPFQNHLKTKPYLYNNFSEQIRYCALSDDHPIKPLRQKPFKQFTTNQVLGISQCLDLFLCQVCENVLSSNSELSRVCTGRCPNVYQFHLRKCLHGREMSNNLFLCS